MADRRIDIVSVATALGLGAAAALHFAWARGSTWPRETDEELADLVVGKQPMPPPAASAAVGVALTGAAISVVIAGHAGPERRLGALARIGSRVTARALRARGIGGLVMASAGLATSGDATEEFRRMDQRFYSPLCLALSAGAGRAAAR